MKHIQYTVVRPLAGDMMVTEMQLYENCAPQVFFLYTLLTTKSVVMTNR